MKLFHRLDPRATADHLGYIPFGLDDNNPESAIQQFDKFYAHGGGWDPFEGFSLDMNTKALSYPGDPSILPLAYTKLHDDEEIYVYPHAWVMVLDTKTNDWQVCRMD